MPRYLVLFARQPARQAREKGFASAEAAELFRGFAAGWLEACRSLRATLVVATPPEDCAVWRRELGEPHGVLWISQRGRTFGQRLERAARKIAALGGPVVLAGGDVLPSRESLAAAYRALESGADSAIAPAQDGGISLLALPESDLDLLRGIRQRRRDVFESLRRRLAERGRRVALVPRVADVDSRRELARLVRRDSLLPALIDLANRVLIRLKFSRRADLPSFLALLPADISDLRGPPVPA